MIARCERCGIRLSGGIVFCADCREVDRPAYQDAQKARRERLESIDRNWLERQLEGGWALREIALQARVSETALVRWHRTWCDRVHQNIRFNQTRKTA